jgi:hypothetical protein
MSGGIGGVIFPHASSIAFIMPGRRGASTGFPYPGGAAPQGMDGMVQTLRRPSRLCNTLRRPDASERQCGR